MGTDCNKAHPGTNAIQSSNVEDPLTCLLPDLESDDEVKLVSVVDEGSRCQKDEDKGCIKMSIDKGDVVPKKQTARRIPFVV